MNGPALPMRLLGEVDEAASARLRETLRFAQSAFGYYAKLFRLVGISGADLDNEPPLDVLRRLPRLDGYGLDALSNESLHAGSPIIDVETSSGTTGPRKRRFITPEDDRLETEFLAELFAICGVSGADSAACLDTDPLTLMVSFTKALDALGVREAYALSIGPEFQRTLDALTVLAPTVVITVPSVLERCLDPLIDAFARAGVRGPRTVIYLGEPLSPRVRHAVETRLGAQVFGYYGASETSALGVECGAHSGIHLFTNRVIVELAGEDDDATAEMVVTTLLQRSPPLLRYALEDRVRPLAGACPCGLPYPRAEVLGRVGDSFSVLGAKLSYGAVLSAVYAHADEPGHMQLELSRDDTEGLTIVLPEPLRHAEAEMRRDLIRSHPDIDFLVGSGMLTLGFSYAEPDYFDAARKTRRIVDRRGDSHGAR